MMHYQMRCENTELTPIYLLQVRKLLPGLDFEHLKHACTPRTILT
jgi:hypothetical protein